jgi:hypothetical protein
LIDLPEFKLKAPNRLMLNIMEAQRLDQVKGYALASHDSAMSSYAFKRMGNTLKIAGVLQTLAYVYGECDTLDELQDEYYVKAFEVAAYLEATRVLLNATTFTKSEDVTAFKTVESVIKEICKEKGSASTRDVYTHKSIRSLIRSLEKAGEKNKDVSPSTWVMETVKAIAQVNPEITIDDGSRINYEPSVVKQATNFPDFFPLPSKMASSRRVAPMPTARPIQSKEQSNAGTYDVDALIDSDVF